MNRKLVIDAQIFQTPAWHRGMGKYSLQLVEALLAEIPENGWHNLDIILSSKLPRDPDMIKIVERRLPSAKLIFLDLLPNEIGKQMISARNRRTLDVYINQQERNFQIDFLILSLMQKESRPVFPSSADVKRILLWHDLVPLNYFKIYLGDPLVRLDYLPRMAELFRSDLYICNSKTTANELAYTLAIDKRRIVSIDGGPDERPGKIKEFEIQKPFILMPTGSDPRKNNERAIRAFEDFNQKYGGIYKLAITSFFSGEEMMELNNLCGDLVFTGNIEDAKMNYLYQNCALVLFPSEYEGLGMPIIEALKYGKPVACSDISVFREMSDTAFTYFDPRSVNEITEALGAAINRAGVDTKAYREIAANYSWKNTAKKLTDAVGKMNLGRSAKPKPRLALFAPDPSGESTAGDLAQQSYSEISRLAECTYFLSQRDADVPEQRINYLDYSAPYKRLQPGLGFASHRYEQTIYFVDNSDGVEGVIFSALANPGLVILESINLLRAWRQMVARNFISPSRLELEDTIGQKIGESTPGYLASLIANQQAVVVFSRRNLRIVEAIANKVNPSLRIHLLKKPAPQLVYPEIGNKSSLVSSTTSSSFTEFAEKLVKLHHNLVNQ